MKTFSRKFWENQYNLLASVNPLIKILLTFDKVLTGDLDDIKDEIYRATAVSIHSEDGSFSISSDLMRNVLTELNNYGHSLVLLSDGRTKDDVSLPSEEVLNTILDFNYEVNVNITDSEYLIRLDGNNAVVVFGNKEYVCKHVSIMSDAKNAEVYLPIENTRRMFVASHSTACKGCKSKQCIHNTISGTIRLHDSFRGESIITPSKPYDMHKVTCTLSTDVNTALRDLGSTLLHYKELVAVHDEQHVASSVTRRELEHNTPKETVRVVNTNESDEEILLSVHQYKQAQSCKCGTHSSPVAHSVNGYWRRRSKKDATMIFVKAFARGGSANDRAIINKSIKQKQKVYKV